METALDGILAKADYGLGDDPFSEDDAETASTVTSAYMTEVSRWQAQDKRNQERTPEQAQWALDRAIFQREQGMALLSDSAKTRLTPVLDQVHEALTHMVEGNLSPRRTVAVIQETIRDAGMNGGGITEMPEYTPYEFSRLVRTEAANAYGAEMKAQFDRDDTDSTAMDEADAWPAIHPQCVPAGTQVLAPGVFGGYRVWYSGPLVEITLANGSQLAVTPNHQLVTRNGFASAQSLRKGDDLLYCTGFEGIVLRNPDADGIPTLIEEVVGALAEAGGMTTRSVPSSAEDFHGDGGGMEGEVYVVVPDSLLRGAGIAASEEHIGEDEFSSSESLFRLFATTSKIAAVLFTLGRTLGRPVRGLSVAPVVLGCAAAVNEMLGLQVTANSDTGFDENTADGATVATERLAEEFERLALCVEPLEIVNVVVRDFTGHVFDLQTASTLYIANGVLASNCCCETSEQEGTDGKFYVVLDPQDNACEVCLDLATQVADAVLAQMGEPPIDDSEEAAGGEGE
jgi:hypothetical protein